MRFFDTSTTPAAQIHAALTARDAAADAAVESAVRAILADVKARGDAAILDYTRRFDWPAATLDALEFNSEQMQAADDSQTYEIDGYWMRASANIREFHKAELAQYQSWMHLEDGKAGQFIGQVLKPVERVGVYVPGGKATYPSTVLMTTIPAVIAGVKEIVLCTPAGKDGEIPSLLAAVANHKVDRFFKIGGAQAIGAMAYGTETVPKCDVIVGPGNQYVNAAKRQVYGEVGIDMLAGPSEIAIIADAGANPAFIAADLLAQTEHGPENRGVLFSPSSEVLEHCKVELERQRETLSRREILEQTASNLIFVKTRTVEEAVELSNVLAPEHLELMVREPLAVLPLVKNAGAVLLGENTSAPIGDYWAGPSHTLPTAGAARFSSPLSVATFLKRTSVIYFSREAAASCAEDVARFAEAEGFDAHAAAARLRAQ